MRKHLLLFIVILFALPVLAACASDSAAPAKAVEDYWNVVVAKDAERLPTLVCGAWEEDALTVLDSLQAVSARLEDMSCTQTGTDGDTALVGALDVELDDLVRFAHGDPRLARANVHEDLVSHAKSLRSTPRRPGPRRTAGCAVARRDPEQKPGVP